MRFRMKRSPFWVAVITITVATWLAYFFVRPEYVAGFIVAPSYLILPLLAFARCRDAGEPVWLSLLTWIPVFGTGILLVVGIKPTMWREGDVPPPADRRQPR